MLSKFMVKTILFVILILSAATAMAQPPEVMVGEIDISSLKWGPQTAKIDLTNNSEYLKTLAVLSSIQFDGQYMNPHRSNRVNYSVNPGETKSISQQIIIPGNYGTAKLTIGVYDVIDTLDPLLDYQLVMEQPFTLNYRIPEGMLPYLQEEITLPPMVSNSLDFDAEFIRLFIFLLAEGKTYEQIAEMAGCDLSFVTYTAGMMSGKQYLRTVDGQPKLNLSVITLAEAEEARALAEKVADELTALVEKNIPTHRQNLVTLAKQGIIPPNEDDFMHGGSALYYTYPTVTTLLFWYHLGQMFIDQSKPLTIYEKTDLCRAHIPEHMYAVQGGAYYNGTVFYSAELSGNHQQLTFLDSIPAVWCIENFDDHKVLFPSIHWNWVDSIAPEPFVLDTFIVRVGLKGIGAGGDALVEKARSDFKSIHDKFGHAEFLPGARYWFWNIVASRATLKLIDKGVIVRRSDGFFTYEKL